MAEKKNGNLLKLKKQLKEGILAPLYVFYGEEDYLREMYVNRVKDCVPDGGFPDFNHIKIEGRDVAFSEYDDAWESFPMMTEKKLIHIKDSGIFQLKSGKDEASTEEKKEFWTEKFKRISDDTVVIFDETSVDKRSALYKAAAKVESIKYISVNTFSLTVFKSASVSIAFCVLPSIIASVSSKTITSIDFATTLSISVLYISSSQKSISFLISLLMLAKPLSHMVIR